MNHANEIISGANQCIEALTMLEQSADHLSQYKDDNAVAFLTAQDDYAKTLADRFGPMTLKQYGAFRALAEYIHFCHTCGFPRLEKWRPVVALTAEELAVKVKELSIGD